MPTQTSKYKYCTHNWFVTLTNWPEKCILQAKHQLELKEERGSVGMAPTEQVT